MTDFERALRRTGNHRDRAAAAAEAFVERAGREGLIDVAYTTIDGPVGKLLVAGTKRGLVRVAYSGHLPHDKVLLELAEDLSPRMLEAPGQLDSVRRQLEEYFEGRRTSFDLKLDWRLSHGFGQRVLRHTARIPYGHVSTYKTVAAAAGSPRGGPGRRQRTRREPASDRGSLPPRAAQRWGNRRLRRGPRAQGVPAQPRGRGGEVVGRRRAAPPADLR